MKRKGDRYSMQTSLIVATLKRLLPVGLNMCAPGEQELITLAKNRFTQVQTELDSIDNILNFSRENRRNGGLTVVCVHRKTQRTKSETLSRTTCTCRGR